jgi:nitronate monooxygenase
VILDRLEVPIVLAPLGGGPSTVELAAAVCEAGGLGFLAASYLAPEALEENVAATRALTERPFGVNVFMPVAGPANEPDYAPYIERLRGWAGARGLATGDARFGDDAFAAKLDVLAAARPAVVSFAFGCPDAEVVERMRAAGVESWVTVTDPAEAREAAAAGADALVVQGAEAGGHRGGFSDDAGRPALGLLALLQLVAAEQSLPLVATGGIATGAGIAATLCAGARAAALGTAFMLCPEAGTSAPHREALRAGKAATTLTRAFTGRTARGIRNAFIDEHDAAAPAAFPEIHHVTAPMRAAARASGDADAVNLWAGEAYPLTRELPAAEVVRELARETREAIAAVSRIAEMRKASG